MVIMKSLFVIISLSFFLYGHCCAQDIHFSQFSQTPLMVNPALTGTHGDQRVVLNYKDQWGSIGVPYKTYAVSYDMKLLRKKLEKTSLGAGLYALNDKAGDAGLSTTQVSASFSGIVSLNEKHTASAGLQGGFAKRSINNSNMKWGNQLKDGSYDPGLSSGETADFNTPGYADFSAGLAWNYRKDDRLSASAGLGLFHINRPRQKWLLSDTERLYTKWVASGNAHIGLKSTNTALLPSLLVLQQGPSMEVTIGVMARYQLKENSKYTGNIKGTAVLLGGYYRAGDAFIPAFAFEFSNFALGISYDVNISGLTVASNGRGGVEISLRYINPNPFRKDLPELRHSYF